VAIWAINKLLGMQLSDGSFTFWPNSASVSDWGSIYALHFLTEARRAGYSVPDRCLNRGARHARSVLFTGEEVSTRRTTGYEWRVRQQLRLQAYAAYVLALMDRPERGAMTFLHESRDSELIAESRFLLAGAFALAGDTGTAFRLLPASVHPQEAERETGGTFSSSVRNNAIVLTVLADIAPDHAGIPVLVEYLGRQAQRGRWGSTQENAWAFLALGKAMRQLAGGTYTGTLTVDSVKKADLTAEPYTLADEDLGGKEIGINIQGDGRAYYYWEARGIPVGQTFQERDQGLVVRRSYFDADGGAVRPDSLSHGTLVVVEISILAESQETKNVIIDDMLPAGLEIENPRLESRAALPWLSRNTMRPDYMDIRDDRLLLFLDLPQGREQKFYYAARAVTAGQFVLPPIAAECMYNSALKSLASSGSVKVIRP